MRVARQYSLEEELRAMARAELLEQKRLAERAIAPQPRWYTVGGSELGDPVFTSGSGGVVEPIRFLKDRDGFVWLIGRSDITTYVSFTLPLGFRPVRSHHFWVPTAAGVQGTTVDPNGAVTVREAVSGSWRVA